MAIISKKVEIARRRALVHPDMIVNGQLLDFTFDSANSYIFDGHKASWNTNRDQRAVRVET
jgi:hypothetical protein